MNQMFIFTSKNEDLRDSIMQTSSDLEKVWMKRTSDASITKQIGVKGIEKSKMERSTDCWKLTALQL